MDKGVLFLAHSTEPKPRIIVGVQGSGVHAAFLSTEEAIRFAENILATVERMEGNLHPDDFEDEVEEPTD